MTDTVPSTGQVRPRMVARSFDTKLDAEAWLRSPDFDEPVGVDAVAMPRLDAYAAEWLPARRSRGKSMLKPRTREHYRKLLDAYILPDLGHLTLDAVTVRKVDAWFASLGDSKPTMNAHAYSLLRAIMATAVRQDIIPSNPCRIESAGQANRVHEPVTLTVAEVLALRDAMPPRYRAMVLLAGFCGLRFGELTELRRHDVDLANRRIHVRRAVVRVGGKFVTGSPKSQAGRRVVEVPDPLVPEIAAHLDRFVQDAPEALLFPARQGGHMAPSSLYKPFYRARTAIGHPHLRWHDLRHTSATEAAGISGAGLAELQAHLGQSTAKAAIGYQHTRADRRRVIADGIGEVIEIEARRRTASAT